MTTIIYLPACSCVMALHVPGAETDNTDGNESDLNVVDNDGNTAFHLACLNGHFAVVDYLCSCGTDLEAWYVHQCVNMYQTGYYTIVYFSEGEDGTPLACAASKGHVKIVNYLLGQDVDINGGIKVYSF